METTKDNDAKPESEADLPERHRKGWFRTGAGSIARFEADTPDEYDQAKEVIEAGFRLQDETKAWGVELDDYWKFAHFPWDEENWKTRMERLASHSLSDKEASNLGSLMHDCTSTIEQLWKWLHQLTQHAQNPNIKRDAGQTLGKLYYEARQEENRQKLGKANTEFEHQMAPFGDITKVKESTRKLWRWTQNQMGHHLEFWKRIIQLARPRRNKDGEAQINNDGSIIYEPSLDLQKYLLWERSLRPNRSAAWHEFLDEFEKHPFYTQNLTLSQLTEFGLLWKMALYDVLKAEWKRDAEIRKTAGTNSFIKKFGDLKAVSHMEGAGYKAAKDFFHRFYLPHWSSKQQNDRIMEERRKELEAAAKKNVKSQPLDSES